MQRNKVLGGLYGAAYGDSLGAVTEFCHREEIVKAFPEGCTDYQESISLITKGITPGCVTDDFGSSCYFMKAILNNDGMMNRLIATDAVLEWAKDEIVFGKYAGQNTKSAMERLQMGIVIDENAKARHFGRANTNGGAMKAAPMGLLAKGCFDKAVEYTKDLCWPTHYNSAAVSGACAIACAVAEAQREEATLESIFDKAIEGARISRRQLEKEGFSSFGPYVDVKIKEAIELAKTSTNVDQTIELLNASIGTGIWVQESIPAVFAILAACRGDFKESLHCSINAGGDTDTISSMVGAILGSYHGVEVIDQNAIERINTVNDFLDLKETIERFTCLVLMKEEN